MPGGGFLEVVGHPQKQSVGEGPAGKLERCGELGASFGGDETAMDGEGRYAGQVEGTRKAAPARHAGLGFLLAEDAWLVVD